MYLWSPSARAPTGRRFGHDSERHPQGVHRAEGVHLPAAAVDAAHHGYLRLLRPRGSRVWNTISVSAPHLRGRRDSGAELAFTIRDGIEHVQWGVDALAIDAFVPRMSFFFTAHSDSEAIANRAARAVGRTRCAIDLGAADERSLKLRVPRADGRCVAGVPAAL